MIEKIVTKQRDNILEIRWALNNVCNFKCRYCFPGSNEGNFRSPENIESIVNNFNYMLDCYKADLGKDLIHLQILGGEPTLWPGLVDFISSVKSKHDIYVSILTNGSRTLRWWSENGHLFDNVILSFHGESADVGHTIQVADKLYELKKKITVHALMDDKNWDHCVASVKRMKKESKHPWMIQSKQLVSTPNNKVEYTDEQRKYLQKEFKRYPTIGWVLKNLKLVGRGIIKFYESIGYDSNGKKTRATPQYYIRTGQNRFRGWHCNIGLETLYINFDGELMGSCRQPVFNNRSLNILDPNFMSKFKIVKTPAICGQEKCECASETHVSKYKPIIWKP